MVDTFLRFVKNSYNWGAVFFAFLFSAFYMPNLVFWGDGGFPLTPGFFFILGGTILCLGMFWWMLALKRVHQTHCFWLSAKNNRVFFFFAQILKTGGILLPGASQTAFTASAVARYPQAAMRASATKLSLAATSALLSFALIECESVAERTQSE